MARSLDHGLAAQVAADLGQFAVDDHLGHLGPVVAVVDRPGADAVAKRQHRIILLHQCADPVELLVERILAVVVLHPRHHEGPAFGDQAAVTEALLAQPFDREAVDAAVNRHERDAVAKLAFDDLKQVFIIEQIRVALAPRRFGKGLVEGHGTDREAAAGQDLAPYPVEIAAGGQLHQRVRPLLFRHLRLRQFKADIADVGRGADRGVDLGAQAAADSHRLLAAVRVAGDDDMTVGHRLADDLGWKILARRHLLHLRRDHHLSCQFDLGLHTSSFCKILRSGGQKKIRAASQDAARTFYGRKSRYLPGRSSDSRIILGPRLPGGFPLSGGISSGILQPSSPLTALAQRYGFAPYSLFTAAIPKEGRRHQRRSVWR